jgi:uncharacterized membrane protein
MVSDDIPPGWTYNPASWPQRLPIIGTAVLGFGIAVYLGLYQLQVLSDVWEPFFGEGSRVVLESWVSQEASSWFGLPDALLGALGYLADAIAGAVGGTRRWRTMPWIVVLFGIFIGPLGIVSVSLVILQPFVGGWCTLCLVTAVISIVMIGPAMDEVLASLQHLRRSNDAGRSLWRTFWGLDEAVPAAGPVIGARAFR